MKKYGFKENSVVVTKDEFISFISKEELLKFEEKLDSLLVMASLTNFDISFFRKDSLFGDSASILLDDIENDNRFSFIITKKMKSNEFSEASLSVSLPLVTYEKLGSKYRYNMRTTKIGEINELLDMIISIICEIKN